MRSGFLPDRIVHLHPTRRCNLACRHCYSESDPSRSAALDSATLLRVLPLLSDEGYTQLSLSGGEPLLYPELPRVVACARESGLRVTLVTNGLLIGTRHAALLDQLAGIAISFDGLAATHDSMRGRAGAFELARTALSRLADSGRPVAAAISLTRDALPELPELVDVLVASGARALQVRPVARAGRARELGAESFCGPADCARLYLVVLALRQELPADVRLHCDLQPAAGLWQERQAYAGLLGDCAARPLVDRPLADLVNPLVITGDGVLKPIAYDFDALYDIGTLAETCAEHLAAYKRNGVRRLQALIGGALAELTERGGLVDWFDTCARRSERRAVPHSPALLSERGAALSRALGELHEVRGELHEA
jgi:pyruvate-formate lyase-activating enzyme